MEKHASMLGGNEAGSAYYHYYRLSLVALLFAKPVGLYDCMLQSSSRSERVKNVLRRKIGDYFSGGLMEHGLLHTLHHRSIILYHDDV